MRSFIDTNVLVYADDSAYQDKQNLASELIGELRLAGEGVLSIQLLQEYIAVATRKLGVDLALAQRRMQPTCTAKNNEFTAR